MSSSDGTASRKRPRELKWLGPELTYRPTHRGATVTARVSTGPKAPRRPLTAPSETAARPPASAARPLWQPQWSWLPLEGCGEFCFGTKWFWRTLAMARPSTGGPGTSPEVAAQRQREWEQRQRDEGIVKGKQYGRWEQSATGNKRWRRGVPKEERPWEG